MWAALLLCLLGVGDATQSPTRAPSTATPTAPTAPTTQAPTNAPTTAVPTFSPTITWEDIDVAEIERNLTCNLANVPYKIYETMKSPMCIVVSDTNYTMFYPIVDEFTMLEIENSFNQSWQLLLFPCRFLLSLSPSKHSFLHWHAFGSGWIQRTTCQFTFAWRLARNRHPGE